MPKRDRAPDREPRTTSAGPAEPPAPSDAGTDSDAVPTSPARQTRRPVRRRSLPQTPGRREKGVTGIVGDHSQAGTDRSGDDTRRRGWFWHWNSIVTQYAPLVGLKGVGLLNSYTVWTDRREESPTRGYAFPSQQREAAFYGEDRAELITINKILVALDLIEIRKEMVLRTDEKGRRWRVPHNFYRVKDQGDGFTLTTDAVRRVVELADTDTAVYRYVRRIFSPKFAPIDSTNVWHGILAELRPTETWQRLAAKAEKTEKRASARSRAGHASRRAQTGDSGFSLPSSGDTGTPEAPPAATRIDSTQIGNDSCNDSDATVVDDANRGSRIDVAPPNSGSGEKRRGSADESNNARPTSVRPSNRTYYQESTTTTESPKSVRTQEPGLPETPPPPALPARDRAFRQFEEANDRDISRAEQRLLASLAADVRDRAGLSKEMAWRWVADAIDEAVAAGSTYVAPRRVGEIVLRWSRDGRGDNPPPRQSQRGRAPVTSDGAASHRSGGAPVTDGDGAGHKPRRRAVPPPPRRGDAIRVPAFAVPEAGLTNHQIWSAVIDDVLRGGTISRVDVDGWLRLSGIVASEDDGLVVGVPHVLAEQRAAHRFRRTLEAAVARVTGMRMSLRFVVGDGSPEGESATGG